mgnify:CR=1 FL=1
MTEKEVLFSVQHLKKYFHVGKNAILKAVDDVSFDIYKGETLGMVGESGCGKTTCGRTCIGLYDRTDGKVLYKGQDVHALDPKEKRSFKKEVQMVFQDPYASLHPNHTLWRTLAEPLQIHGIRDVAPRVTTALEQVGLAADAVRRYPHQLSGGQRQRVAIARALLLRPQILLLDEPTSALDPQMVGEVLEVMRKLAGEGLTMIIVTHEMAFARDVSSHVAFMAGGVIVEEGEPSQIFGAPKQLQTQEFLSRFMHG